MKKEFKMKLELETDKSIVKKKNIEGFLEKVKEIENFLNFIKKPTVLYLDENGIFFYTSFKEHVSPLCMIGIYEKKMICEISEIKKDYSGNLTNGINDLFEYLEFIFERWEKE